ncbi:hypothetical protein QTP88_022071 [Uroleucon formosanum]
MDINTTEGNDYTSNPTNGYIPNMIIKQEVQDDSYGIYTPQVAETSQIKDTEDTSEEENDGINNMKIKDTEDTSDEENDGMNNVELNDPLVRNNMYAESNNFINNMIFQRYNMDINTTEGNDYTSNPTNGYIPNMIIKQEVQDDSYGIYTPQVAESSQVMIKQEVIDERLLMVSL